MKVRLCISSKNARMIIIMRKCISYSYRRQIYNNQNLFVIMASLSRPQTPPTERSRDVLRMRMVSTYPQYICCCSFHPVEGVFVVIYRKKNRHTVST